MAKNNILTRRQFFIAATRKAILAMLAAISAILGFKNLSNTGQACEVNLACRHCFKLGNCNEDIAITMRKEIRQRHLNKDISGEGR